MRLAANATLDLELNAERYDFLRWAATAFDRLRLLPPNRGICHQVNLETLATVVTVADGLARPDMVLGTDSHTPMINALGVLGWGVGGIQAEAALLGLPVTMQLPRVVGVRITGEPALGTTATDIGLTISQRLRAHGVMNTFVEFTEPGLDRLPLTSRATISNMSRSTAAPASSFRSTSRLHYLRLTGRSPHHRRCRRQRTRPIHRTLQSDGPRERQRPGGAGNPMTPSIDHAARWGSRRCGHGVLVSGRTVTLDSQWWNWSSPPPC